MTPGNIEQYLCTGQEVGACDLAALGLDHTNVEQLKVAVMRKTGGVWWDATLYPTMKLDQWVVSNTKLVDAATGTVLVLAAEQGAVSAGAKSLSDAAAQSATSKDGSMDSFAMFPDWDSNVAKASSSCCTGDCTEEAGKPIQRLIQCSDRSECSSSNAACIKASAPLVYGDGVLVKPTETRAGRLFYMHIPKTGGSSIEYAGQRAGHAWGRLDTFYDAVGRDHKDKLCGSPWHEPFQYNLWLVCFGCFGSKRAWLWWVVRGCRDTALSPARSGS